MPAPTLNAARLVLKGATKATQTEVVWLRDPEVVRYSEQRHKEHTLSTQLRYVTSFKGFLWGIYELRNHIHIGNLSAALDGENNIADVGILIGDKNYWQKGYGLEAWKTACSWLLDGDGGRIRKLEAGCMANNIGMRRILDKSGFKLEGERLNHFLFESMPVGMVYYGKFK